MLGVKLKKSNMSCTHQLLTAYSNIDSVENDRDCSCCALLLQTR